ncbi:hypothetical protein ACXR8U_33045 (plasmid) [Methylobacterium radiotolerans]|jgi:hypothetical protein
MRNAAAALILLEATACVAQPVAVVPVSYVTVPPPADPLYRPKRVAPGVLAYAPDHDTFAPILTERHPYPTQGQANAAYQRALEGLVPVHGSPSALTALAQPSAPLAVGSPLSPPTAGAPIPERLPTAVRLFACKPGAIDSQTAKVRRYDSAIPVVVCATDFLDAAGDTLIRAPVNFYYHRRAWHVDFANPPAQLVRWFGRTSSPRDPWRWLPGRDRYE